MKAVVLTAFGGAENLILRDMPDPVAGPGEVLVRVKACALNHLDIWVRSGLPIPKIKLPHILGCDVAGELMTGERVAVHPGRSCGACASRPPCSGSPPRAT